MHLLLEIYLAVGAVCLGIILIAVLGGAFAVAISGREGWGYELNEFIVLIAIIGLLWPLVVFTPFIAVYRAVMNK